MNTRTPHHKSHRSLIHKQIDIPLTEAVFQLCTIYLVRNFKGALDNRAQKLATIVPNMATRSMQNDLAVKFRKLHVPGEPLVLTNVYDAATASIIAEHPSTKAIATASYAVAASQGIADEKLTLSQNLATVRSIATVLKPHGDGLPRIPFTVDIQDGYEDVAATIKEIIALGAVGCNLEDFDNANNRLRPMSQAVERIHLAMQAARDAGVPDFVINARTDVLLKHDGANGGSIEDAIERGKAYLEAGACTVFVWGGSARGGVSKEEIQRLVEAFDGRLNVKMNLQEGYLTPREIKEIGVARISLGPELYRAAMTAFKEKADAVLAYCG
jgi:2-methylisocitrate lyase-like PEP mutase family enzyme